MVQKVLYKNWLLVSKISWGIWTTSDKQWEVQKVETWWATTFVQRTNFPQKYIPSAKALYTEDLTLDTETFNYLRKNLPNFFSKPWVIFHDTTPLYFIGQTLHTFYKSGPLKFKRSGFLLLGVKVHQIPHVIF